MSSETRSINSVSSLAESDYLRLCNLLYEHCGLHFSDSRRSELEHAIRQAFAASTCATLDEYYRLLTGPNPNTVELDRLINAVTVNETHFFRDAAQFNALYHYVLPQLLKHQRPTRTLRIWSAGCASGEEPYSIAMLLLELLPDVDQWAITILGTDINTEALNRARRATYGEWAFREDRARQWRSRYFQPSQGNRYELIPAVREMVTFTRLNLAEPSYPAFETNTTALNLILCRNVTIYFSKDITALVVERFYHALMDGGWLVTGHAEYSLETFHRFQTRTCLDAIVYQRDGQLATAPLPRLWTLEPAQNNQAISSRPLVIKPAAPAPALTPAVAPSAPITEIDPVEQARELIEYGHTERAREVLLECVRQQADQVQAYTLLGQVYANLGAWKEAEQWCRRATQVNALALNAYYTLALVLQHQHKLEGAIDAMRKVIYLDRVNVLGHYGLANLYYACRQLPQAQKSLDNARRLLEARAADEMIPESGGITVGRLREAITRQQQQWSAESAAGQNGR